MHRPFGRLILLILFLVIPATLFGAAIPAPDGYVRDDAGILSRSTELKIEHFLEEFERTDSTQIAVLTVRSLEGEPVEAYALAVAEAWGIGQKGKDNGALLLVAKDDRKIRIEVGYGLEGRLTDLLAGRIIDDEIAPRFRQGDYDGGIVAGVASMAEAVRGEYEGTGRTRGKKRNPLGFLSLLLFLGPGLLMFGGPRRRYGHRHVPFWIGGPFGGGRGGGGFGGFSGGGGGFGGGGASGGW